MNRQKTLFGFGAAALMLGVFFFLAQQAAQSQPATVGPTPPIPATILSNAPTLTVVPTNRTGGAIQFATPIADFGNAKCGDIVKYDYVFTNVAVLAITTNSCASDSDILEIKAVQPQCGCTLVGDWTRRVEPGKTGVIPIQFNTSAYVGPVLKYITVTTSDPKQTTIMLQLKGTVWRPIDVNPLYAIANIGPDATNGVASVVITNNLNETISLSPPQSLTPAFIPELTTIVPGKSWTLTVRTAGRLSPGTVSGQITIKTSTTNASVVNVICLANVQAPIIVSPGAITLPPGPLLAPLTNFITIQNNSTNALTLSDLAVNAEGAGVQLEEKSQGKSFLARVWFPQGFQMSTQQVAFTAVSSNPTFPQVRVAVSQPPRPPIQPQILPTAQPAPPPPTH